jgi:hypothetical protein
MLAVLQTPSNSMLQAPVQQPCQRLCHIPTPHQLRLPQEVIEAVASAAVAPVGLKLKGSPLAVRQWLQQQVLEGPMPATPRAKQTPDN